MIARCSIRRAPLSIDLKRHEVDRLARWINEPVAFGEEVLGRKYAPGQVEVLEAVRDNRNTVVHSGHNVGKTLVLADLTVWWLTTRRPAKVITTAPTFRQVNDLLWEEIRASTSKVDFGLPPPLMTPEWKVRANHFARGVSTDRPHRLQGYHSPNLLAVIDEAAGVDPRTWFQIRTFNPACLVAAGNPEETDGDFYRAACSRNWRTVHMSCLDFPNVVEDRVVYPGMVTRRWVDEIREEYGEDSPYFISRVLGLFPEQGEDCLISLASVSAAMRRPAEEAGLGGWTVACDVARFGYNETVIAVMEGRVLRKLRAYRGRDTMHTAGAVADAAGGCGAAPVIVVDADGIGAGVVDRLRELGHGVVEFHGGYPARNEAKFVNVRSEAWWGLREALRLGEVALEEDEVLRGQLVSVHYEHRSRGAVEVERKETMRGRGVASPDRADAVVMALWGSTFSRVSSYSSSRIRPPERVKTLRSLTGARRPAHGPGSSRRRSEKKARDRGPREKYNPTTGKTEFTWPEND